MPNAINSLLVSENDNLKEQIKELLTSNKSSQGTIEILERKFARAEASALKSFQERNSDVDVIKKSLRTANNDLEKYKKDLQAKNKCIKEKYVNPSPFHNLQTFSTTSCP